MSALVRTLGVCLSLSTLSGVAAAETNARSFEIAIPAGSLAAALERLGEQSGLQIMYEPALARGITVAAVNGTITVEDALARLLTKTDLRADRVNDKTIVLRHAPAKEATPVGKNQPEPPTANRPNPESFENLEEIVVTAQKREQRLQDVPISISVISGAALDRSAAEGLTEALSRVPGTAINVTAQGGATQVVMRGVAAGDALFSGSSPVSYYLDSAPFGLVRQAIAPDTSAYDLERVEVLRGPQGTLYGASAQNGVVRVLTRDADPSGFEFKARTSASETEGGGGNYRGDMAVNVPIVDGRVAARAVLGYQNSSGWIDRANQRDVNDAEIKNLRLKLNAQATDSLSLGLSAWFSRTDLGGPSTSDDDLKQLAVLPEPIETDFDTYSLKIGYDVAAFSIAASSSYLKYSNDSFRDYIYFGPDLREQDVFDSEVLSQEILFNSKQDGPWRWSLGGMYRDAEDLQLQVYHTGGTIIPLSDQTYISESFAVFGELSRRFLDDRLEWTAGLRYFEDRVTSRDDQRDVRDTEKFDAVSPRVVLTWYPQDDLTAYMSYAEGFRSGFPQSGYLLENAPGFPPLDPDTLHNYEVGAKGALWGGSVSFDTAIYYIDWQDVQQSLTVPVTVGSGLLATALINSESASGVGIDAGITFRPLAGLELGLNFGWNDLAMDADVISQGLVLFEKGDRLNLSPEYMAGARAQYEFPVGGDGLMGVWSVSGNYTSGMDLRTVDLSSARSIASGDDMLIARTSFAITTPGNWTASLFVENLTNEEGSPVRFPFAPGLVTDWDARVRPRTIGLQLECRFD